MLALFPLLVALASSPARADGTCSPEIPVAQDLAAVAAATANAETILTAPTLEQIRSEGQVMRPGQVGAPVRDLQDLLADLGFQVDETGTFDEQTEKALKKAQEIYGLTADGRLGSKTLEKLLEALDAAITVEQLREIMPELSESRAKELLPYLIAAMYEFEINTKERKAAFLAQVAHESDQLNTFEEYGSGEEYEGRKDLGNTQPGDGKRFKGRGPIQITGRDNYRRAGEALGIDLEEHPSRAADLDVTFRIAGWFWKEHDLNELADENTNKSFKEITKAINGGTKGLSKRKKFWKKAKKALEGESMRETFEKQRAENLACSPLPSSEPGQDTQAPESPTTSSSTTPEPTQTEPPQPRFRHRRPLRLPPWLRKRRW